MLNNSCPVCSTTLSQGHTDWHFLCKKCHYEAANLLPSINSIVSHKLVDEKSREIGLKDLRAANFKELMTHLKILKPNGGMLLDVGCAHGWFLDHAKDHFQAHGVEPDHAVYLETLNKEHNLREGYFPDVLDATDRYDLIVFNDVFEHIPNIQSTLNSCAHHLNNEGLLVINIPSSTGFFYRLSKILTKINLPSSFFRMWQKDYPSPHLHYFSVDNLLQLTQLNGFMKVSVFSLPSIRVRGLYHRISHVEHNRWFKNLIVYIATLLLMPVVRAFDSDIIVVITQKSENAIGN